jgi:hypothetical protein
MLMSKPLFLALVLLAAYNTIAELWYWVRVVTVDGFTTVPPWRLGLTGCTIVMWCYVWMVSESVQW